MEAGEEGENWRKTKQILAFVFSLTGDYLNLCINSACFTTA